MQLFKIKTNWLQENNETGALSKTRTEELVEAINYTEAEKVANTIAENEKRFALGDLDIVIQRIDNVYDILYQSVLAKDENLVDGLVCSYFEADDDTEVGLYSVKVVTTEMDDKGKEKDVARILMVPARSNGEASKLAKLHMKQVLDYKDPIVKDVRFDRSSAILLNPQTYKRIADKEITL